ncbi:hypothetical protein [Streptomyces sp. NPDC049879]|uniref:hypothetical protein n=1 Tax=Streptomyces sp. NPDC049879 TaxID=3365598 RepID=UPI0037BAF4E4
MYRLIKTSELARLRDAAAADEVDATEAVKYAALCEAACARAADAETRAEQLHHELMDAVAARTRAEIEAAGLRDAAEERLDAEDRVALRALLRTARRQARDNRVYLLWHRGELHSVHATPEDAEMAAEREGAPRSGWTAWPTQTPPVPACEVLWRVRSITVGGPRHDA